MNNIDFARPSPIHSLRSENFHFVDTVISTCIILRRNIYNIPFSHRQEQEHLARLKTISEIFIKESGIRGLSMLEINSLDKVTKRFLREKNIISFAMETSENSFVILNTTDDFIILINDSDHFKIQVVKPGLQLSESYDTANVADNELNKFAPYAYSENYGFITSDPSNHGIEISVILHLPVLCLTKRIVDVLDIAKISGFNIEGLKQEGFKTFGGLYKLSGGHAACISEMSMLGEFQKITQKIIRTESEERENYFSEHKIKMEDKIFRSYGILKYSKRMGYVESMDLLSDIRLGIILSTVKNLELSRINDLMMNMQWAHMQKISKTIFTDTSEGDIFRASYLRDQF